MFGTKLYFTACKAAAVAAAVAAATTTRFLLTCILEISTRASDVIFSLFEGLSRTLH